MKIVTGYTGTPHITSNDDQARNQEIFGTGNYIFKVGKELKATLTNATTVTLQDGDGIMQGVHFRIEPGMTEAVSISPGTTGYNRIDLICARYTKNVSTGVEDVSLVVIEGTPTTSTASQPTYTQGDILNGDTLAEFPFYKISLTGVNVSISSLFTPIYLNHQSLMWVNPSFGQTSSLTVYLDLSQYRGIEVLYKSADASGHSPIRCRHYVGETSPAMYLNIQTSLVCHARNVTVAEGSISFSQCYTFIYYSGSGTTQTDSGALVPYQIYGIY